MNVRKMLKGDKIMKREICDLACLWISVAIPQISTIKESIESIQSLSDTILFDKLYYVMDNQDSDFNDWLKIVENFDKDNANYNKMVKQIIYNINAINEVDLLQAYSNLLRAYKMGFVCKNDFLRLGFTLTKLLAEDANYLKNNIQHEKIKENIYCLALSANNLMYNSSRGFAENEADMGIDFYRFTDLGKMMDKYALDFGNEEKYTYRDKDAELSEQKLSYTDTKVPATFG